MKKAKKYLFIGFLAMFMIAFLSGPAISAKSVTIMEQSMQMVKS